MTHTVTHGARLKRMSVAVLLDASSGKPRTDEEVKRLETLTKSAVGFDVARGDQFQISSSAFNKPVEPPEAKPSFLDSPRIMRIAQLVGGVILLLIALMAVSKMRALGASAGSNVAMLRPGAKVAELEAMMDQNALGPARLGAVSQPALADPHAAMRDRARDIARTDPARAAHLLKAWIQADGERS